MAIEEHLPPACAFAVSVLQEREIDPDEVPEEAVEAAQQHLATCIRCLSSPPVIASPRKKRRVRRQGEEPGRAPVEQQGREPAPLSREPPGVTVTLEEAVPTAAPQTGYPQEPPPRTAPATRTVSTSASEPPSQRALTAQTLPAVLESADGPFDCAQCRQLLPAYAEAMDSGENVAELYPEVHTHLLICDAGCLVLLDLFRQEARANRKYRRRLVRDPFSAIGWELSGFFRTGQVPMSPMALAYGTLILLLIIASLSAFLAIHWDDARYYRPPITHHMLPTPDGAGISDGLHIYDACNADSYQAKRQAAQALRENNAGKAATLLSQAVTATTTDVSGCNGAEAAIYREDLRVRQSGHPFGVLVIGFDSGPGSADPNGGTDRHVLYAAYTQELVGSYIAQAHYNSTRLNVPGAPLLYLVLANTSGNAQGALQIANTLATMAGATDLSRLGLLATGHAPLLGVVGLAPSSLLQVALPVLCRAGIPVISPTATGLFIVNQIVNTLMYQHCTPGFAVARFSADDAEQSTAAANYAYTRLGARNVAVFYDPSDPSSQDSAQSFLSAFRQKPHSRIVAQETAMSNGLLDSNGRPGASSDVLLDGLNDALQANPRPDLIFAPMLTSDVITLGQAIAKLPANQQPTLMIGGEFAHPSALQELVQWARQQQLTLPHIYVSLSSAARPPVSDWQKQFYASFCQSFAKPGSFCSGSAALDQGALLFADSVEMVSLALSTTNLAGQLPTPIQLIQKLSKENFAGVSCQVNVMLIDKVLIISHGVSPVILGVQGDGSLQIVG